MDVVSIAKLKELSYIIQTNTSYERLESIIYHREVRL